MTKQELIRAYYLSWVSKRWRGVERLLSEDFTFSSPNGDDHIDKRAFHAKCWPEADSIKHIEVESISGSEREAFVKYLCRTKNGRSFRNIEFFRFNGTKITAIECYFGGSQGYPSQAT